MGPKNSTHPKLIALLMLVAVAGAPLLLVWASGRGFAPGRLRRYLRSTPVSGAAAGVALTASG